MTDIFTIRTNLSRTVVLGVIAVIAAAVYCLITSNVGTLLLLILLIGVFLQYILSKKIYKIVLDKQNQKVAFTYLQLQKRSIVYGRESLQVKRRVDVHFRGGKEEIFEIYNKKNGKKIFEVSKRSFKSPTDYKRFIELFEISEY